MTTNRSLERIIADQMRTWALGNKAKYQAVWRPLITVSRSFGAQGAALARMVGERTGYTVWDRDLVHAIAKEAGGDERVLATVDEHRRGQIDEALRGLIVGFSNSNVQYFRSLIRVIRTISLHGSAIIVGRGPTGATGRAGTTSQGNRTPGLARRENQRLCRSEYGRGPIGGGHQGCREGRLCELSLSAADPGCRTL